MDPEILMNNTIMIAFIIISLNLVLVLMGYSTKVGTKYNIEQCNVLKG